MHKPLLQRALCAVSPGPSVCEAYVKLDVLSTTPNGEAGVMNLVQGSKDQQEPSIGQSLYLLHAWRVRINL
jgi:hypothetical protein